MKSFVEVTGRYPEKIRAISERFQRHRKYPGLYQSFIGEGIMPRD
jgi:hypothetical protein